MSCAPEKQCVVNVADLTLGMGEAAVTINLF